MFYTFLTVDNGLFFATLYMTCYVVHTKLDLLGKKCVFEIKMRLFVIRDEEL